MRMLRLDSRAVAFAAFAIGAGMLLGIAGWLEPYGPVEFSGLLVAAMLTSGLATRQPTAEDRGIMPPSFVLDFTALLLFGCGPALVVASAGAVINGRLTDSARAEPSRRMLADAVIVMVATLAAGVAHRALGGTIGHFVWPWQGVPIAAAVAAYSVVKSALAHPLNRARLPHALRECPMYFIGASVAVGFAEVLDHRTWEVLPVAAVPLYFACRAYSDYVSRLDDEHRVRAIIDSVDQGISAVDSSGRVTRWDDAVERLVGCTRARVRGRALVDAVPALRDTGLAPAINEALKDRQPRTLSFGLPSAATMRMLQVKIVPVAGGAALLWLDVTERTCVEQALTRGAERLALAAEGANDGLWEWDLRTQEFYGSTRWRMLLGLAEADGIGSPQEWIDRVHPDDLAALKDAIEAHVEGHTKRVHHEHRIRRNDGSYRWFLCRGLAGGPGRRPSRIAGSFTDITDRVTALEQLRTAGFRDPLTGLRTRADFLEGLGRRLDEFKRRPSDLFAVLYLDLDRLKLVNDSLGHPVGDELLVAVSRRLESCLRQEDLLGRLGGDEFAILLNRIGDEPQANVVALRIQDALNAPLSVGGRDVFTSVSIGIVIGHGRYGSPDEIISDADTAMYQAKARGKARHELFDAEMQERARDRLGLEHDLRHAVNNNDFDVVYQPIVLLATGMCVGFESLVRWTRTGKPVSPAIFIPVAEELGVIEPLGTWILQQACQRFADWQRRFPAAGLKYITVNASSRQLTKQNFPYLVEQAVHQSGMNPGDLRIEVTETALMDNPHLAAEVLTQLRDFGVKIYLDDFGTGCSSLSHLHKLPVDALKIDRSFVMSLLLPERPAIVESILALARTLETSVVAEGIETEVQASELERLGCTHAQGYLFSKPLSAQAAEQLIMANQPLGPKRPREAAAAADSEIYYSSKSIEWPEHQAPAIISHASNRPALTAT